MFLNVDNISDIFFSLTRLYMSLLMVTAMCVLMLVTMRKMYPNERVNRMLIAGSSIVFFISLSFLRNQTEISDVQYMKAMIPHHSSAIMTSKNAHLKDPQVKELADRIIQSQRKEIIQMEEILERLE